MYYVISAENYDPVFCTPYENKYKDGYNPVTLTEAYRVPSDAKIQIWQSIVRLCHNLGGKHPTVYSHNAQRFTACFYGYINTIDVNVSIFVVITPKCTRWMFVDDNRDGLEARDYMSKLLILLCRDNIKYVTERTLEEVRAYIPVSRQPYKDQISLIQQNYDVPHILVVYDYIDETIKLYGGLTKKEQSISDHISMIPVHEVYKRIAFCIENNTTTYDGRKIRRH